MVTVQRRGPPIRPISARERKRYRSGVAHRVSEAETGNVLPDGHLAGPPMKVARLPQRINILAIGDSLRLRLCKKGEAGDNGKPGDRTGASIWQASLVM